MAPSDVGVAGGLRAAAATPEHSDSETQKLIYLLILAKINRSLCSVSSRHREWNYFRVIFFVDAKTVYITKPNLIRQKEHRQYWWL